MNRSENHPVQKISKNQSEFAASERNNHSREIEFLFIYGYLTLL